MILDEPKPIPRTAWRREVLRGAPLSPLDRAVAYELAEYGNPDGTSIHPGVKLLAQDIRNTEQAVSVTVKKLRDFGFIARVERGNSRAGLSDAYILTRPSAKQLAELEDDFQAKAQGRKRDTSNATKQAKDLRAARKAERGSVPSRRNQDEEQDSPSVPSRGTISSVTTAGLVPSPRTDQFHHDGDHQDGGPGNTPGKDQESDPVEREALRLLGGITSTARLNDWCSYENGYALMEYPSVRTTVQELFRSLP